MKLSDLLTRKLELLRPEESVQEAGAHMRRQKASTMPVARERRLVGMVDQPDPDLEAARHGHDPKLVTVGEAMKPHAAYCREDQDCEAALKIMNAHHLDVLPVVDRHRRIVGLVHRDELSGEDEAGGA